MSIWVLKYVTMSTCSCIEKSTLLRVVLTRRVHDYEYFSRQEYMTTSTALDQSTWLRLLPLTRVLDHKYWSSKEYLTIRALYSREYPNTSTALTESTWLRVLLSQGTRLRVQPSTRVRDHPCAAFSESTSPRTSTALANVKIITVAAPTWNKMQHDEQLQQQRRQWRSIF